MTRTFGIIAACATYLAASPAIAELTREMTPAEAAWFDGWTARIVTSINAARAVKKLERCTVSPPEHARREVRLGRDGIAPVEWRFELDCGDGPRGGIDVNLSPSPCEFDNEAIGAAPQPLNALSSGSAWMRLGDRLNFRRSGYLVGAVTNAHRTPPSPGVAAQPRCAEVGLYRNVNGFTDEVPPASIDAALSSTVAPPPPAVTRATEGPALVDPALRRTREREVYAFLLTRWGKPPTRIAIQATRQGRPDVDAKKWLAVAPDLLKSTFEDRVAPTKPSPFPADLVVAGSKIDLIDRAEQRRFFGRHEKGWDGWVEFRKVHGDTGIVEFSAVSFSRDLRQAFVYYGGQSDWLAGGAAYVLLERGEKGWRVLYEQELWVS